MLRALAAITVTTTLAHAESPDERTARASQLTEQAKAAARSDQCAIVELLEPQVRAIDAAYYRASFAADPAIVKCGAPVPEPTYSIATRRRGITGGISLGGGEGTQVDLRLGWVADRDMVLYGAASFGKHGDYGQLSYRMFGVGMRWWLLDVVFVDARIGRGYRDGSCFPKCAPGVGSHVGGGLEIGRWKHAAIELTLGYTHIPDFGAVVGSFGVSVY